MLFRFGNTPLAIELKKTGTSMPHSVCDKLQQGEAFFVLRAGWLLKFGEFLGNRRWKEEFASLGIVVATAHRVD
tara:strand:+ start:3668 stop:3889 length:222 start_codon:yes stop_codon:yes gene_type:complete